ncbi:hypothetical protein VTN00DRAFT_9746 [Thermoascus crustaceus]|uniref:uncharacterized protein n=1 Tax=Thermoascus crustaceus TaxID=5088 RepID=UPI0037438369
MITTRFYISVGGGSRAGAVWRIIAITIAVWSVGGVLFPQPASLSSTPHPTNPPSPTTSTSRESSPPSTTHTSAPSAAPNAGTSAPQPSAAPSPQ